VKATVYGIPGSHPVRAGLAMLDRKGIEWKLVDVPLVLCRPFLRARGFPGPTVPAMRFDDGRRLQTTRKISRELDRMVPEPPLFPGDPEKRAAVEAAEQWGDEVYQPVPRRAVYAALSRDRSSLGTFIERPLLGLPPKLAVYAAAPLLPFGARINKSNDDVVRDDLAALPAMLDRVDALIEEGVIGGDEPNAADFQIGVTTRLLMNWDDLRPFIEGRPAANHATRLFPAYPGRVPAVYPADWLAPLQRATAS